MKQIKDLLQGATVEWRSLEEIAVKISSGGTPKTGISEYYNGDIPWLRTQEVDFGEVWDTGIKITEAGLKNSSAKLIPANCVIVAMYGATVGKIAINKIPLATNQACANIQIDQNIANYRYVFHYLSSKYKTIKALGTGSQTNINAQIVKKFQIPIPPLEVQAHIVRILDKFTELTEELTAELTAELTMRRKQYEYYREQLLTFDDTVEWRSLGDIFDLKNGYTPSKSNKKYWENGTIPWFRMDDIRENGQILNQALQQVTKSAVKSGKLFPANSIIISTSATIGEHALITVPHLSNQRFTNLSLKAEYRDRFEIKFLFYYCFLLDEWCKNNTTISSFASVDMSGFKKFQIPIPPLEKQAYIVSILDKFDTLTCSIKEGLPREIELRRQQYEYYREKLLTFPQP